jgi:hypothetical protein
LRTTILKAFNEAWQQMQAAQQLPHANEEAQKQENSALGGA